ncbi:MULTISPECIES: hypothetical protein [unclassified Fusibacter]|uniref:hypothetical protein n=1 Tax=unclassified Fusibacter TaxID=2624464 RepID=UPI001010CA64|nr:MULTISPECIES: hypothetical protein [unclassified Fusibacter]MCK8060465.1 hypothetical protein [Fusibacter sp. A2]NPE20246.1 hypothetical protein [Fusibacter sp. A1]RXV63453.1 hypothetical protein DWB64_00340 [Fusibacter sp. A1]
MAKALEKLNNKIDYHHHLLLNSVNTFEKTIVDDGGIDRILDLLYHSFIFLVVHFRFEEHTISLVNLNLLSELETEHRRLLLELPPMDKWAFMVANHSAELLSILNEDFTVTHFLWERKFFSELPRLDFPSSKYPTSSGVMIMLYFESALLIKLIGSGNLSEYHQLLRQFTKTRLKGKIIPNAQLIVDLSDWSFTKDDSHTHKENLKDLFHIENLRPNLIITPLYKENFVFKELLNPTDDIITSTTELIHLIDTKNIEIGFLQDALVIGNYSDYETYFSDFLGL